MVEKFSNAFKKALIFGLTPESGTDKKSILLTFQMA